MTKRPKNKCMSCHYTWFPRGNDVSRKCPNCRSDDVGIDGWGQPLSPEPRITSVAPQPARKEFYVTHIHTHDTRPPVNSTSKRPANAGRFGKNVAIGIAALFVLVLLVRFFESTPPKPTAAHVVHHAARASASKAAKVVDLPEARLPARRGCGSSEAIIPAQISPQDWRNYTCQTRKQARKRWSRCLNKEQYLKPGLYGCPTRHLCCPP